MTQGQATGERTRARSAAIDLVRVLGVLAVIVGHFYSGPDGPPRLIDAAIYSWQVPVFFFLTGYLWKRGRSLRSEATSRARSLLVPYFAWMLIFGVPLVIISTVSTGGIPWESIGTTLWGGGVVRGSFAPYWFLPVLFFAATAMRALERMPAWVAWGTAAVGLVAAYVWGDVLALSPLNVLVAVPCLAFVLLGQMVSAVQGRVRARGLIGAALLVGGLGVFLLGLVAPLDMKLGDFGTPVLSVFVSAAICTGLIWTAKATLDGVTVPTSGLVNELALVSVVVLLTHTFAFIPPLALGLPGIVVLGFAVCVSWALGLLIHRTPASTLLAGVSRKIENAPGLLDKKQPGGI